MTPPAGRRPRRSIRARILLAFVLSLAAWLGAFGYTLAQLQAVGEGIAVLDQGYLPLAEVAARTEATARQLDQDHARFARGEAALAGARASTSLYRASLEEAARRGLDVTREATTAAAEPADAAAFDTASRAFQAIVAQAQAYEEAVDAWARATQERPADATGPTTAEARALSDMGLLRTQLLGTASDLSALVDGRIERVSQRTAAAQSRAQAVGGGAGLLAIAMAGAMAGAALLTLRPVAELTRQVQRIAAGEEAGRVEIRSADEVGLLADEFNAMADAVAERDRRLSERAAALDALSLRLRSILDTIHAGLVVVEDDRASTVNPAATLLWELSAGDALPAWLVALGPGRHEAVALPGEEEDEEGGEAPRLFDVEVVPFGAGGRLIVGEDVTARVRDRERLARSERLALVGQMLAQITHEVRNPLNAMSLHAELLTEELQDSGGSSEGRAMLDTIATEIARLEQVTARYLDLSRRREPELSPENVTALVRGVLQTDEALWRRAGAQVALDGEVPGVVELAGDTLRRAVRNLVRNAVEAGAHHVTVRLDRARDTVLVDVGDDGPGIAEDALRRVFDPFFTTKVKGTGLGLAISRQELEEAGGSLSVTSVPGASTTFRISLPGRWEEDEDASPEDDTLSVD